MILCWFGIHNWRRGGREGDMTYVWRRCTRCNTYECFDIREPQEGWGECDDARFEDDAIAETDTALDL